MTARSTSHLPSSSLGPSENVGIAPTSSWSFPLILACFLFSGFAALLYEVVWLRQFSIIFGTSEFALAVILAAYLAGLQAGLFPSTGEVARLWRREAEFKPRMPAELREDLYDAWLAAVARVRTVA